MYTMQMLVDKLNQGQIAKQDLCPKDPVHSVRIFSETVMKDYVVYLSVSEDGSSTVLQTKRGSVLTYRAELTVTMNLLLEILDHYDAWEKEFTDACRQGCTLAELLDLVYPILPYPLIILDNHEWMVACSSALRNPGAELNQDLSDMLHSRTSAAEKIAEFNKRFHSCFRRKDVYKIPGEIFTNNGYAFNLFHNNKLSGILLMELFRDTAEPGKLDLFQLVGEHIQNMLNDPSSGLSIGEEKNALHCYLEESSLENEKKLVHELRISSWKSSDPKQVIFISPPSEQGLSPNRNHTLLMFNRLFALIAAEYRNGIMLLVNRRILSERSGDHLVLQRITQLAYCAGISNTFTDIAQLPVMVQRAVIALQKGDHNPGAVNYFEDHFLRCLFSMFKKEDADILQHPLLDQLQSHDKRYGSHLYQTLFVFLENERSIAKTAAQMDLHRSTLIHRIERIEEMAQGLLDQPENRLHVLISYYLNKEHIWQQ